MTSAARHQPAPGSTVVQTPTKWAWRPERDYFWHGVNAFRFGFPRELADYLQSKRYAWRRAAWLDGWDAGEAEQGRKVTV